MPGRGKATKPNRQVMLAVPCPTCHAGIGKQCKYEYENAPRHYKERFEALRKLHVRGQNHASSE